MNIRQLGSGLITIVSLAVGYSCAAKEVLPSLTPELAYQSLVDRLCIQGYSLRIYRLAGSVGIERAKHKVASIIPARSVAEIESDYLFAQWGSATESKLIGLWSVAPAQVQGIYSVLTADSWNRPFTEAPDCRVNDASPESMIGWVHPGMGLLNLFSIVDYSRDKPTHIAMYSSWIGTSALTASVKAALQANGWILRDGHKGLAPYATTRTIHASREQVQIELSVFSTRGTSVIYMVAQ